MANKRKKSLIAFTEYDLRKGLKVDMQKLRKKETTSKQKELT